MEQHREDEKSVKMINYSDNDEQESKPVSTQFRLLIKTSIIFLAGLSVFVFTVWAWFANNGRILPTGANVSISESKVELACAVKNEARHFLPNLMSGNSRTITAYYNCRPDANNTMQVTGEAVNQNLTLLTTDFNQTIRWYLDYTESDFRDQSEELLLEPGTHGQLVFYVVANRVSGTIPLSIQLNGYTLDEEGDITIERATDAENEQEAEIDNDTKYQVSLITDERTKAILQHHILFFGEYDENTKLYSNWLSDGTFSIDMSSVKPGEAVKVTLYWIWPSYFDEYIGGERTTFCEAEGTDYKAIKSNMTEHPEYYFSNTGNDITIDNALMNEDRIEQARLAFNTADSDIGSEVHFMQATISLN